MRIPFLLALAASAHALNILITNDDGFSTANVREMYRAMTALGHNCYLVASPTDQSGQGARLAFADSATLAADAQFGIVHAGAPSLGTDPDDDHIWYYDGSPATQVLVALDHVLPNHANFATPDLVMAGPDYGLHAGPFLYTVSGTLGAALTALQRGIPAIAFAGVYGTHTPYFWVNETTAAGLQDPATITGRLAAALAHALITSASLSNASNPSDRLLPRGYGVSVNMPLITSFASSACVNPPFVLARMTGDGAHTSQAVYDNATGLFSAASMAAAGTGLCIHGDCSLPREVDVISSGCQSSVVVFTADYDAPHSSARAGGGVVDPYALLPALVQRSDAPVLVGGLGAHASVEGAARTAPNSTATATATALPRSEGERQKQVDAMSSLALVIGVAAVLMLL